MLQPPPPNESVFGGRVIEWVSESCSVVSDSLWPHGLCSPRNSPGQNPGVGCLSLLQGIFPTRGWNPGLPFCRQILYQLSHKGGPRILGWVACPFSRGSSTQESTQDLLYCGQIRYVRGAWHATVHGFTKKTQLSNWTTTIARLNEAFRRSSNLYQWCPQEKRRWGSDRHRRKTIRRHREEVAVYKARRPVSETETNLEDTLIADFWSPKLRRSKFLLFKLTHLWFFVKAAPANQCTNELLCDLGWLIQYLRGSEKLCGQRWIHIPLTLLSHTSEGLLHGACG